MTPDEIAVALIRIHLLNALNLVMVVQDTLAQSDDVFTRNLLADIHRDIERAIDRQVVHDEL